MRIAVLACANGLGHVRRVVAITSFILKNGFDGQITAFLPSSHLEALRDWKECQFFINNPSVQIVDFTYPIKYSKKSTSLFDKHWNTINIPNIKDYNIVWSDNITQILEERADAILTGSFFWYEVFAYAKENSGLENFIKKQREIIKKYRPLMIGNEYFSTPEVVNNTKFCPVGLYRYDLMFREKTNKNILLSCGLGGEEEDIAREAVSQIIKDRIKPPEALFIEPRLIPKKYPSWIKKADFSSEMFHSCLAVCIRPGLGTISDALVNRTRIFAFSTEESFEMMHNCSILEKLRVGKRCTSPLDSYFEALEYLSSKEQIELQNLRTSHLRMDGVFATANIILGIQEIQPTETQKK